MDQNASSSVTAVQTIADSIPFQKNATTLDITVNILLSKKWNCCGTFALGVK
jgi:hypothetical protein